MLNQKSCIPNTGNAGNYYSWPAATAGGSKTEGDELNSICPTGWRLATTTTADSKSYYSLIINVYNSGNDNSKARNHPLSFIIIGFYGGSPSYRAQYGHYWASTAVGDDAYDFGVNSGSLDTQSKFAKSYGFGVRCVSR